MLISIGSTTIQALSKPTPRKLKISDESINVSLNVGVWAQNQAQA